MNKKETLILIHEELEIESVKELSVETVYKDLEEWDSMSVIILIGFLRKIFQLPLAVKL